MQTHTYEDTVTELLFSSLHLESATLQAIRESFSAKPSHANYRCSLKHLIENLFFSSFLK
jgi:hypothetical protein